MDRENMTRKHVCLAQFHKRNMKAAHDPDEQTSHVKCAFSRVKITISHVTGYFKMSNFNTRKENNLVFELDMYMWLFFYMWNTISRGWIKTWNHCIYLLLLMTLPYFLTAQMQLERVNWTSCQVIYIFHVSYSQPYETGKFKFQFTY